MTRVAFVGQRTYYEASCLSAPAGGIEPTFIDFRDGGPVEPLLEALTDFDPDAVVAFRPETLPAGTTAGIRAPVLGVVTEPLPRSDREPTEGLTYNLAELAKVDSGNVDRVIVLDSRSWDSAAALGLPVWRSMPLPVDDALYRKPVRSRRPPRVIYVGYSTMHREETLLTLKHEFDVRHYAHGLLGDELLRVFADADVALSIRGERWVDAFDHNILRHLAAGHLVIAESVDPRYGLEPGADYVEVADRFELDQRVHQLHRMPDAYDRVRIRGHSMSRRFAASKVWPRVVGDLLADVAAFGRD